jgi:hypothetical protein
MTRSKSRSDKNGVLVSFDNYTVDGDNDDGADDIDRQQ